MRKQNPQPQYQAVLSFEAISPPHDSVFLLTVGAPPRCVSALKLVSLWQRCASAVPSPLSPMNALIWFLRARRYSALRG